ncbi:MULTISPECIES: hypothetical protein [unclassified Bradyrhizobium]|uniref:hypothetical protein n=1 Tax=unclassified Bradyrhizobium TaxID=2631580 RepID=UPI002916F18C|nr:MULTISPECIES: hypothetical protein [unclassified Bradyrhizobium]
MTDESDNPRRAAVRRHNEGLERAAKQTAQQQAARDEREKKWQQDRTEWVTAARQAITLGVEKSNNEFRTEECPYVIAERGDTHVSVSYHIVPIQRSRMPPPASFSFVLKNDGNVHPETTANGCEDFPAPIAVRSVTAEWAEKVSDCVMNAVLGGQRMRIPD